MADLAGAGPDLPEAAARRLVSSAFSSSLAVTDFAAALHMGMRPLAMVQGFAVMGWNRGLYAGAGLRGYGYGYDPVAQYPCPHGWGVHGPGEIVTGITYEAAGLAQVWAEGLERSLARLVEEAAAVGAHGVIGVQDRTRPLIGEGVLEFHLLGTAVTLDEPPPPGAIWTTYLAGAKLAKLLEAGYAPVAVTGAYCELVVQAGCTTEILERGGYDPGGVVRPGSEIVQLSDAATLVRQRVRDRVRATLGECSLHGAELQIDEHRPVLRAVLRGTRIRRVGDAQPLPAPLPTVGMS